jgi:hypothetical protein
MIFSEKNNSEGRTKHILIYCTVQYPRMYLSQYSPTALNSVTVIGQ